jgi:FKBP-type peptidyl-prolyl cis-trans isomerase
MEETASKKKKQSTALPMNESNPELVQKVLQVKRIVKERDVARKNADYGKSDTLRNRLEKDYNVEIIDQREGPSGWKFKDGTSNKLPPGTTLPASSSSQRKKRSRDEESEEPKESKKGKVSHDGKRSAIVSQEMERNRSMLNTLSSITQNPSKKTVQGVVIEEIKAGNGSRTSQIGDRLQVQYVGRLQKNNKIFDSSKKPFQFRLGRHEVISGWEIGCQGMKIGEQRKLTIPPEKGYGKSGSPPVIPSNATLVFDVTLVGIK